MQTAKQLKSIPNNPYNIIDQKKKKKVIKLEQQPEVNDIKEEKEVQLQKSEYEEVLGDIRVKQDGIMKDS